MQKMHKRLFDLMEKHSKVSVAHMGMPEDWAVDPFWRVKNNDIG